MQETFFDGIKYYYQSNWFNEEALRQLYLGDAHLNHDPQEYKNLEGHPAETRAIQRALEAGMDGLMPKVVEDLKRLFGEGNYRYDGWEVGPDVASLYFFLRADRYEWLMSRLENWVKAHELEDMVEFT